MKKDVKASKEIIFLTGCINPAGMSFTMLQDPEERKRQYIDAINFYLTGTSLPILFVENSGVNISGVFADEIQKGRLEIITFEGNSYDKSLGKGFGEMLIIKKALEDSRLLKDADFIFKITGRYKLLNIKSFLSQYRRAHDIEIMVDLLHQLQYSDSRFWGSTPRFLKEILLKYKNKINDSENYYFEHALCHATHEGISKRYTYSSLKYKSRFAGIQATDNKKYNPLLISWLIPNLKQMIRYRSFLS